MSFSFSKHEKNAIFAVVSWLAFGCVLSLNNSDWSYFERCGAVVTIIGVLIAVMDFSGRLDGISSDIVLEYKILNVLSRLNPEIQKAMIEQGIDQKGTMAEFKNVEKKAKDHFLLFEGGIIIFGTFVWGFSSLFLEFIFPLKT